MHNLLCTFSDEQKKKWPQFVLEMVMMYDSMPHAAKGFTPHQLMLGQSPKLPVNHLFEISSSEQTKIRENTFQS